MSQVKKNVATTTRQVAINAESSVASGLLLNHQGKLWIEHAGERVACRVSSFSLTWIASRSQLSTPNLRLFGMQHATCRSAQDLLSLGCLPAELTLSARQQAAIVMIL